MIGGRIIAIQTVFSIMIQQHQKFINYFYNHPDTAKIYYSPDVFKSKGIKTQLRILNDEKNQQKDLGNYLVGVFKYQTAADDFFGQISLQVGGSIETYASSGIFEKSTLQTLTGY